MHTCPVWMGYVLANPIRKLLHSPRKHVVPYVCEGARVLDVGCAMGFFSLPMAEKVGPTGTVFCVDVQQGMLDVLLKRAGKAGFEDCIEPRLCRPDSLDIDDLCGSIDFALLFAMVHEVPDPARLLAEVTAALKPGGQALLAEPRGHVTRSDFDASVALAEQQGLRAVSAPIIGGSHTALLVRA